MRKYIVVCIVGLMFGTLLLFGKSTNVKGAEKGELNTIQSVNISTVNCDLSISNIGMTTINIGVVGNIGTTQITTKTELQKYNASTSSWSNVRSWTDSVNSSTISRKYTHALGSKGNYRCKLTVIAVRNGKSETIVKYNNKTFN